MSQKHIDVMLSSTSKDLPEYRKEAIDAVWRAKMFPIAMETLTGADNDAIGISFKMVDDAEIYVGIFAHRYGFIPKDPRNPDAISITEMEYRRAIDRGIPILIFVMDNSYKLSISEAEHDTYFETSDESKAKLKAFKEELLDKHVVGFFKDPADLRALLIQALFDPELRTKAEARSGENDPIPEKDSVIPRPPELYSVPPYIQTGEFIGRARELAQLDQWAKSADPIMIVDAIGGQGKSALTWQWVNKRATGYDGMLWWSFYERGATMNAFMRHAIAYIEGSDPNDRKYQTMQHEDRKQRLLALLQGGRYLIVLDGLERILTAYHRLDKAQLRDEQVSDEKDMRACIDPKDTEVIFQLAGVSPSKILVSTRLVPRTLEKHGSMIKGVKHIRLTGLSPDDAEAMFITDGVIYTDTTQLHDFLKQFGYHGLLLKMVIGRIKNDRRARGDFDTWIKGRGKDFDFTRTNITERRTQILEFAMEGLDDHAKTLLSRIAAFNDGVQFDVLEVVANPDGDVDTFDQALTELEDRGLLQWDRETDTYDLHPVVRGFAFKDLTGDERVNTYNRIYNYFNNQEYDLTSVTNINQLQIPINIYQALIGAERFDDAITFLRYSFGNILLEDLTAYPKIIQILNPFFKTEQFESSKTLSKSNQSYIMNHIGASYSEAGMSKEGLSVFSQTFKFDVEQKSKDNIMIGLANYGSVAWYANHLYIQAQAYRLLLDYTHTIGREYDIAYLRLFVAYMIHGDWHQIKSVQNKLAKIIYKKPYYDYFQAELQFHQHRNPSRKLNSAIYRGQYEGFRRVTMESYGLYILYSLNYNRFSQAIDYAQKAIALARQSGTFYLARYLGRLARVKAKQSYFDEALNLIDEAWRGTVVKFDEAELHNCTAEVYRAMNDTEKAIDNAVNAYKIAWADGPPYINWWQLEQAKAHLDALGVPYPDMPPFDESKMEKLPYEDEIRAYLEELKREKAEREAQESENNNDED